MLYSAIRELKTIQRQIELARAGLTSLLLESGAIGRKDSPETGPEPGLGERKTSDEATDYDEDDNVTVPIKDAPLPATGTRSKLPERQVRTSFVKQIRAIRSSPGANAKFLRRSPNTLMAVATSRWRFSPGTRAAVEASQLSWRAPVNQPHRRRQRTVAHYAARRPGARPLRTGAHGRRAARALAGAAE